MDVENSIPQDLLELLRKAQNQAYAKKAAETLLIKALQIADEHKIEFIFMSMISLKAENNEQFEDESEKLKEKVDGKTFMLDLDPTLLKGVSFAVTDPVLVRRFFEVYQQFQAESAIKGDHGSKVNFLGVDDGGLAPVIIGQGEDESLAETLEQGTMFGIAVPKEKNNNDDTGESEVKKMGRR